MLDSSRNSWTSQWWWWWWWLLLLLLLLPWQNTQAWWLANHVLFMDLCGLPAGEQPLSHQNSTQSLRSAILSFHHVSLPRGSFISFFLSVPDSDPSLVRPTRPSTDTTMTDTCHTCNPSTTTPNPYDAQPNGTGPPLQDPFNLFSSPPPPPPPVLHPHLLSILHMAPISPPVHTPAPLHPSHTCPKWVMRISLAFTLHPHTLLGEFAESELTVLSWRTSQISGRSSWTRCTPLHVLTTSMDGFLTDSSFCVSTFFLLVDSFIHSSACSHLHRLFYGNFVLDNTVPKQLLDMCTNHTKHEFTHIQYSVCWELMSKCSGSWILHYVKSAYAITDVPDQVRPSFPCCHLSPWPISNRSPNSSPNAVDGSTAPLPPLSTQQSTSTTSTTHPTPPYVKRGSTLRWCTSS